MVCIYIFIILPEIIKNIHYNYSSYFAPTPWYIYRLQLLGFPILFSFVWELATPWLHTLVGHSSNLGDISTSLSLSSSTYLSDASWHRYLYLHDAAHRIFNSDFHVALLESLWYRGWNKHTDFLPPFSSSFWYVSYLCIQRSPSQHLAWYLARFPPTLNWSGSRSNIFSIYVSSSFSFAKLALAALARARFHHWLDIFSNFLGCSRAENQKVLKPTRGEIISVIPWPLLPSPSLLLIARKISY